MAQVTTRFDLRGLKTVRKRLEAELSIGTPGPAHRMLERWGHRYLSFTEERYIRMSRGGWPPISRRTAIRKGSTAILIDNGFLVKGLQRGRTGNLFKFIPGGVRVGYSANVRHPRSDETFAEIAMKHQTGAGRLPVRKIFVPPDTSTVTAMQNEVNIAIEQLGKMAEQQL